MRVLFVTPYFSPYMGGIERTVDELSRRLTLRREVEKISILTTFSSFPSGVIQAPPFQIDQNREILRLHFKPKNIPGVYHSFNAGFFARDLKTTIYKISPDIIHYWKVEWYIPNIALYLLMRERSKYILSSSYHKKPIRPKHYLMIMMNRMLFTKISAFHTPSMSAAEELTRIFKVPREKIDVIHLGGDGALRHKPKQENENRRVRILCVGRLSIDKGQYRLIEAFSKITPNIREKSELFLIGRDAGDLPRIKKCVQEYHLSNVQIQEEVSDTDLHAIYSSSDIAVIPSAYESFSLAAIEALSYGLPILAFDHGGLPEIATKGSVLIRPYDLHALANNLENLIMNSALRKQLGQDGYNFVANTYSWDKMTDRILMLYQSVLDPGI